MLGRIKRMWRNLADRRVDPREQIRQAMEEGRRRHHRLREQAAIVIGREHELRARHTRAQDRVADLESRTTQALVLANRARTAGNPDKAEAHERQARLLAGELVNAVEAVGQRESQLDQAVQATEVARSTVERSALSLRRRLVELSALLSRAEQTRMQLEINAALQRLDPVASQGDPLALERLRERVDDDHARAFGEAQALTGPVDLDRELREAVVDDILDRLRRKAEGE
ncbi:PspA/IM30 family protein [Rhizohabitans arisaemae]|uniref:PspA/IM30 family protein n=1 Tax=Rhizohabitans arisaemae TaxID=2720610 RepID=UPI0024B1FFDB|nr:PspA/IM30 family protein [Rhizohabitans arisaemae]